ncbi:hypothetical protein QYF36_021519 [Acer negundo]|nr:hypothetical protein QYF36_021519 [Acer negundo]
MDIQSGGTNSKQKQKKCEGGARSSTPAAAAANKSVALDDSDSHSSLQGELLNEEQNVDRWENWPSFDDTILEVNQNDDMNESEGDQLPSILVGTQPRHEDIQGDLVGTKPEAPIEPMMITIGQEEGNDDAKTKNDDETRIEQEEPTPHILVPSDHSLENTPEVQYLNSSPNNPIDNSIDYRLHFRDNRGKPPNRYSPDHGEKKSRYPIVNHVSTQRLS